MTEEEILLEADKIRARRERDKNAGTGSLGRVV